jgi:hypothetical protein
MYILPPQPWGSGQRGQPMGQRRGGWDGDAWRPAMAFRTRQRSFGQGYKLPLRFPVFAHDLSKVVVGHHPETVHIVRHFENCGSQTARLLLQGQSPAPTLASRGAERSIEGGQLQASVSRISSPRISRPYNALPFHVIANTRPFSWPRSRGHRNGHDTRRPANPQVRRFTAQPE